MKPSTFSEYAKQGFSHVPVVREVGADLDTPLSAYLKLANKPYSFLFESVHGGERWGRYSIIGLQCDEVISVRGQEIVRKQQGHIVEQLVHADPLAWIENYRQQFKLPEIAGLPRFIGGLVGYFGYETIRYIEPRLAKEQKPDALNAPDICLMTSGELLVFDSLKSSVFIVLLVSTEDAANLAKAQLRIDELAAGMQQKVSLPVLDLSDKPATDLDFVSGFSQAGFKIAVEEARNYIEQGDAMQVVLSQRLSAPFHGEPLDVYRHLRRLNPSPHMYYLDMGDFQIVGSSPEILVRQEEQQVTLRPIAGTRPRGANAEEDLALEKELLSDPKELAEHLMLIDLGRNDVGRIAKTGTVELTDKMIIERYSHVMHIVSNVTGELLDDYSSMDVLRATFPAGTVSGAPKIRAMEIIDELEPIKRGVYSGAIGYLSWYGDMDTAIAIRTAVIQDQTIHVQAGAGIVYDSIPENEWQETMNKAKAVLRAAALADKPAKQ